MRRISSILLLILCLSASLLLTPNASSDVDALLDFKKSITSSSSSSSSHILDSWRRQQSLSDSTACPQNWLGVACDTDGRSIVSITLTSMSLTGPIDFSPLSSIQSLRNLSLSDNRFAGPLPAEIASLSSLRLLDLSHNSFDGPLPSALQNLTNLTYLDLRGNRLSGELDGIVGLLRSAVHVDLSGNTFSGSISSVFDGNSTVVADSLSYLNVSGNKLSGEMFVGDPAPMFDSLEVFDASFNQFTGNVPSFNFIVSLRVLRLGNNRLSGSLPEALYKQSSMVLEELDLSCNQITGPLKIITSSTLKMLNLSTNKLTGSLPARVGSCATVDLSNNVFSGNLAAVQSWGNYVEFIDLSSNKLTGTLPNETSQFLRLMYFKVSNNLLSGELPAVIGSYPEINVIDFSRNQLLGSIPYTLFTSLRLIDLNLSGNSITGHIPFPNPASSMSSDVPSLPSQNSSLISLDLSNNLLSGSLPQEISTMSQLKLLNLGRNNISGQIPEEIALLNKLLYIDLSNNHFEGRIPDNLPDDLLGFNISYNGFSGIVPDNLLRFPDSSFHPGNSLLVFPHVPPSNVPRLSGKNHSRLKNAIIYSLVAGVLSSVFLILVSVFVYRKVSQRDKTTVQQQTPITSLFGHRDITKTTVPSTSIAQDHLVIPRTASIPLGHEDVSETSKEPKEPVSRESPPNAEHSDHERVSTCLPGTKGKSSMSFIISSPRNDPCSSENPSMLNVCSPDRLVGDLHLFDNSVLFTAEELSRAPAEIIGRSCHGTSYKATLASGHVLAVKWLREGIAKTKKEFYREAKKLGTIRHPNLVSLRGYYWGPREHEKLIISDYINSTSLTAHLCEFEARGLQPLSLSQRLAIANKIASCLNYLHNEKAIPHGNIKSTNVLIYTPNMDVLLTDYSLHRIMTPAGMADQVLNAGALGYRPPEFAHTSKPCPSLKSDVYAFGVVLLEILTGKGAGEIAYGNPDVVDLTEWVRLLASENNPYECFDKVIPEVNSPDGPPKVLESILSVALRCIRGASERPEIRTVFEDLSSISL